MVLDLATEDFVGLWELDWRTRTVERSGGSPISDSAVRAEVNRLLAEGQIALYKGVRFNGDESATEVEEARSAITDPANWLPPPDGRQHFRLAATAKGEEEYRRHFRKA